MRANHDGWWPGLFHKRDFQPGMKIVGCAWWEWLHKNGFFSRCASTRAIFGRPVVLAVALLPSLLLVSILLSWPTTGGHTGTLRTLFLIDPIQCSLEGQEFDVGRTGSLPKVGSIQAWWMCTAGFCWPIDRWLLTDLHFDVIRAGVCSASGAWTKNLGPLPSFSTCARTSLAPAIDIICPAPSHAAKEADDAPGLRH